MKRLSLIAGLALLGCSAMAQAEVPCSDFLKGGDEARQTHAALIAIYVTGLRDSESVSCPSPPKTAAEAKSLNDAQKASCAFASGGDRFLKRDTMGQMTLLEKACRTYPSENMRSAVLRSLTEILNG